jgi:O-succinylbenzoic acid--CoA ligase
VSTVCRIEPTSTEMNDRLSILSAAERQPDAAAIVTPGGVRTRLDVARSVSGWIGWLRAQGVSPGDTQPVAFVAELSVRNVEFLLALIELGVAVLPLHDRWNSAQRDAAVRACGACLLEIPSEAPNAAQVPAVAAIDPERPLAIVYSSGSTDLPRGVVLSRRAFVNSARASAQALPFRDDDHWLLTLPLAHVGGLSVVTRCLLAGKAVVLSSDHVSGFDPDVALAAMRRCSATLVSLVPTQLQALVERERDCPKSLRAAIVGGAALPTNLAQRAYSAGWPILTTYGLTETCAQVTLQRCSTPREAVSSITCGSPLPGVEVRIVDGLIQIRCGSLLSALVPAGPTGVNAEGWLATSDLGELDQGGELVVLGRADDVIITGGENVNPLLVERVLTEHPSVARACVFGVPSERWGHEVAVAIVVETGQVVDGLESWLGTRLASFQRPRWLALVEQLPTLPNGKVDRRACQRSVRDRCVPLHYD